METNAGLIIKLLVFALDLFIVVFNFLAFKNYLPIQDARHRHVEVRNKAQQTYVAGDIEPKMLMDRKQNYQYRNSANNLVNKNMQPNCTYSSNGRSNPNHIIESGGHTPKYFPDNGDKDYRREHKYNRSQCQCEYCKEAKRSLTGK